MSNKEKISDIQAWLDGSKSYAEGVGILKKCTRNFRAYIKLLGRETEHTRQKLEHELKKALAMLKSIEAGERKTSEKPTKVPEQVSDSIDEDLLAGLNKDTDAEGQSRIINLWFERSKSYATGRELVRRLPEAGIAYLHLTSYETYQSRSKLISILREYLQMLKD